jgi:hypothetical protein
MEIEKIETCPSCGGTIAFGFGLAGGGVQDEAGDVVPGGYWMCLDCEWMGPKPQETICFPHGMVGQKTGA